jgi:hypothetical protein
MINRISMVIRKGRKIKMYNLAGEHVLSIPSFLATQIVYIKYNSWAV